MLLGEEALAKKKKKQRKEKPPAEPHKGSVLHLQSMLHLPPEERGKYVIQEEMEDWFDNASQGLGMMS